MPKTISYVTNSDLRTALSDQEKSILRKMDEKSKKYRDDILKGLDKVMKELEEMREDSSLGAYQTRNLREDVDSHEKRITKLETA